MTATRSDLRAPDDEAAVVTMPIDGLDCGQCAETLASGLRDSTGILSASVSFGAGTARVAYDPRITSGERVVARIRALGYDVPHSPAAATPSPHVFTISGMDCADCAKSVERAVAALPEIATVRVNLGAGTLTVTPRQERAFSADAVTTVVSRAGYQATPRTSPLAQLARRRWWHDRRLWPVEIALLLWAIGAALDLGGGSATIGTIAYAAALLIGGYPFARAGLQAIHVRRLDMNVLMTISAIGAALLGEWGEGAMVVVLFAIGGTLQALTLDRTRGAIRALMDLSPPEALVVRDGHEEIVPVAALRLGDLVRVKPGGRIPADGRIVEGTAAVDQAAITGESIPVDKVADDDVFAGTICGAGSLLIEVTRLADDSTLARIVHQVEEAQGSRAPSQALIDRFAAIYTPVVIAAAVLLASGGALLSDEPRTWIYRALVLLVIACPCALVISTPVSIVAAIGAASRRGILVKGGAALEAAGMARVVALDKTGTLTPGRPVVSDIVAIDGARDDEILALAAAVELLSEHPLARAIVAHARHAGVTIPRADAFTALTGRGARAMVGGREVLVGSPRLIAEQGGFATNSNAARVEAEIARLAADGKTPLLVAMRDDATSTVAVIGLLALIDA
ncbi:MAG: heavy metal translocating P-type ATPase, partial [Chloroflexota bacterium]|nr:heavy metal translocating P-type ATPase [Chloroflexota bacterium]